jgi:hypothetical protein
MNASMIAPREYVKQAHTAESSINEELLNFAKDFYQQTLTEGHKKQILSMSMQDKLWLLSQYREECKNFSRPDLDNLY